MARTGKGSFQRVSTAFSLRNQKTAAKNDAKGRLQSRAQKTSHPPDGIVRSVDAGGVPTMKAESVKARKGIRKTGRLSITADRVD